MDASVDPDRCEWDVVVIGGGPPGENVADYATVESGLSAVIVSATGGGLMSCNVRVSIRCPTQRYAGATA